MAITDEEKILINHKDGQDIATAINGVASAILGSATTADLTMDKVKALIRLGVAPNLIKVGDEFTFSESPSLATLIDGNTVENATTAITALNCTLAIFVAKVGSSSGISKQFYYYGGAWHIDSITGDVVTLSDYGITYSGTAKANDYILVALSSSKFTAQVADFDHYTLKNPGIKHHMVLSLKQCIRDAQQFDNNPQLAIANTIAVIPAGKYKVTTKTAGDNDRVADGVWVFTTSKDIPLNGGVWFDKIGNWYDGSVTKTTNFPTTAKTYAADHSTVLETLSLTAYNSSTDSDAVDLGTFSREYDSTITYKTAYGYLNFARRVANGSGDYASSIYRQWLNATTDKATWLKIATIFDIKPSNLWTDQVPGFGCQMDTDLMGAIQKTKVTYYMCDSDYNLMTALGLSVPPQYLNVDGVTVSGRTITCEDYFFPLSIVEVGLGNQWNDDVAGNKVLALYDGATNKDRIKYFGTTAGYWWLRSPHPWDCHDAAVVNPGGSLNGYIASSSRAVVPACSIG
jgi:hypothetical protein